MSSRFSKWPILFSVAAVTLIADRITKHVVASNLALGETWDAPLSVVKRLASITFTTNTGAAFGLFPDQGIVFVIIAFAVIAAIFVYYRHLPEGHILARLASGLMLGGVLGNLIDRLRQGYVVDFVDFNFWPLQNWPVWNLADSAIVVGVGLLAFTMLLEDFRDQGESVVSSESDVAGEPTSASESDVDVAA